MGPPLQVSAAGMLECSIHSRGGVGAACSLTGGVRGFWEEGGDRGVPGLKEGPAKRSAGAVSGKDKKWWWALELRALLKLMGSAEKVRARRIRVRVVVRAGWG